jgi:hypothetical protein
MKIDYILGKHYDRPKTYENILKINQDWITGIDLINGFVNAETPTADDLSKLTDWLGARGKFIPVFHDEIESATDLKGIVSTREKSLALAINKDIGGHSLYMQVYFDGVDEIIQKSKLSIIDVQKILSNHLKSIDNIKEEFTDFIFKFENLDDANKKIISRLQFIKAYCRKRHQGYEQYKILDRYRYCFKANQIEYLKQDDSVFCIDLEFTPDKLRASRIHEEQWAGLWIAAKKEPGKNKILVGSLYVSRDVEENLSTIIEYLSAGYRFDVVQHYVDGIGETVRHEVQHLVQTIINNVKNFTNEKGDEIEYRAGLPAEKLRSIYYDPYGKPLKSPIEGDKRKDQEHALRDIEFYTRLSDDIGLFNKYKTNLPVKYHYLFAKAWVGAPRAKHELQVQIIKDLRDEAHKKGIEIFKTNPYDKEAIDPTLPLKDNEVQRKLSIAVKSNYYKFDIIDAIGSDDIGVSEAGNSYNKFFLQLKKLSPAKYYKAVKEFIKLV